MFSHRSPQGFKETAQEILWTVRDATTIELITLSAVMEPLVMPYLPIQYNGLLLIPQFSLNCFAVAFPVLAGMAAGDVAHSFMKGEKYLEPTEPSATKAVLHTLGGLAGYGALKFALSL